MLTGSLMLLATASAQGKGTTPLRKPSMCFAFCEDPTRTIFYGGSCTTSSDCVNRCDCDACCIDMNTGCDTPESPQQSSREVCSHRTEDGKGCAWCTATSKCATISACPPSTS